MKVQNEVTIDRPIAEVFEVATCLRRCVVWIGPIVDSEITSDGVFGVGTTFDQKVQFLGRALHTTGTVTHYDPPHAFAYAGNSGPVLFEARFSFEPTAAGTRFTVTVESQPRSAFEGIATPFLARMLKRQYASDMHTLKDLLENDINVGEQRAAGRPGEAAG